MNFDFKEINIGRLIEQRVVETGISMDKIIGFLKYGEEEVREMYTQYSIEASLLIRWSELLEYDFFRIFSHHLILYSPPSRISETKKSKESLPTFPEFRKNVYTKEIISFILELIQNNEKTKDQVIEEYRIPKTTLYKWIYKYTELSNERERLSSSTGKT